MSIFTAFSARPLDPIDLPQVRELAKACGLHGVYVQNALSDSRAGGGTAWEGEALAFHGVEDLPALAWFGSRGNLIVLQARELPADQVAAAIRSSGWGWRIVLGPPAVVDALALLCQGTPLVHREQIYYGLRPEEVSRDLLRTDVRRPVRADVPRLIAAGLQLNEADLRVNPRKVDRGWLKRMVRGRIEDGTTRVIGRVGRPVCKLDFGSEGAAGRIVEGVFTFPDARGKGLATALVATVAAESQGQFPVVCLHVGANNAPARAAYRRAGMRSHERCSLMLLG